MEIYGYIAAIFMGLTLGLVGGGGSILTVPILVYLFSMNPLIATSNSLFLVGATALLGAIFAVRRGEVNLKTGIGFAIPSFVGVYLTKTFLLPRIPDEVFSFAGYILTKPLLVMGFFAALMLMASFSMIRKKNDGNQLVGQGNGLSVAIQGLLVGGVTGFVGAGGGFLIVPALVNLVGLKMRTAIGTSLAIIAANSLFGFSVAIFNGLVAPWSQLIAILAVALIGLVIGSYYSSRIPEKKLKIGFGYFVLIMGALILFDQINKLK